MPYNKKYQTNPNKPKSTLEYRKFRVRGHIKSFRDLEIYQQTTKLASEIYLLTLPQTLENKKIIEPEIKILKTISKHIPKTIAEAYGDKFTNHQLAYQKLEKCMRNISILIAKIDFLIAMINHQETKQTLVKLIGRYQIQRRKILNLKKAWIRIDEKYNQNKPLTHETNHETPTK